jgi:membrane fusion protein (multidrug efflux system)
MTDRAEAAQQSVPAASIETKARRGRGRRIRRLILLVLLPLLMIAAGTTWYAFTGRYVTTENAYVKAHVIAISTDIDGRVVEVFVRNDKRVKAGDLLFRLDPDPHWLHLQIADAKIESVRNAIDGMRAEYRQIEAEIAEGSESVRYFQREAERQRALAKSGAGTAAKLDEAEFELAAARQKLRGLREKIRKVLAELGGDPERAAELHPHYLEALAERNMAELQLGYTNVRAPADGIATQVPLEPGEWLEAGEPAFGLIEIDETWVVANLKETELTHVREGQPVEVAVDAYPGLAWKARITSIAPATGAEFAVLPPQNASGNWVKVVQRVPVRIDLEQTADQPPLRAGMTASISIDTGRERRLLTAAREAIAAWREDRSQAKAE